MRLQTPKQAHLDFRNDVLAVLEKHKTRLDAVDMLAVTSHLVGQLIALQDQTKVTPEMALAVVSANIEKGNAEVLDPVLAVKVTQ